MAKSSLLLSIVLIIKLSSTTAQPTNLTTTTTPRIFVSDVEKQMIKLSSTAAHPTNLTTATTPRIFVTDVAKQIIKLSSTTAHPTNLTTTTTPRIFVSDVAKQCWSECQESTDAWRIFHLCVFNFVLEEMHVGPYWSCAVRHPGCKDDCQNCLQAGNSICVISDRRPKDYVNELYTCRCELMCKCPTSCEEQGICVLEDGKCLCQPDH